LRCGVTPQAALSIATVSNRTGVLIPDGAKKWIRKSEYPLIGVPVTIKGKPIGSGISWRAAQREEAVKSEGPGMSEGRIG